MSLELSSPSFGDGQEIPRRHTRRGGNVSPPLRWRGAPPAAKSFALIVEDPDAPQGVFHHWAIFDLPATCTELTEGAGQSCAGFRTASNDFGSERYEGPQPPAGASAHHYHFQLAALDVDRLDVREDADAQDVRAQMQIHALDQADLVGTWAEH